VHHERLEGVEGLQLPGLITQVSVEQTGPRLHLSHVHLVGFLTLKKRSNNNDDDDKRLVPMPRGHAMLHEQDQISEYSHMMAD